MPSRRELTQIIHGLAIEYGKANTYGGRPFPEDMCGLCSIASAALFQSFLINDQLHRSKYKPVFIYGTGFMSSHCWVESDGKVYDPTFKQFGLGHNVYIGNKTVKHEEYAVKTKIVTQIEDLGCWHNDQRPTQERINWFLDRVFLKEDLRLSDKIKKTIFSNREKYFSFANQIKRASLPVDNISHTLGFTCFTT